MTDAAGEFDAPSLTPSTYTVRIQVRGFKTLDRPNVLLEVGKEIRVDLTPQPGEQSQTDSTAGTFRAEFFNVLNHPIIANPFGSVNGYGGGSDPSSGTTFGCGCTTPDIAAGNAIVGSGDSRTIQLGLKLSF